MAAPRRTTKKQIQLHRLRFLYQLPGVVKIVLKRQRFYLGLSLLALVNIILAIGLITNASFFSQAVDRVVLLQELEAFTSVTGRPPFSTSLYVFPTKTHPVTLETAEQLSQNISQTISLEVSLPLRHTGIDLSSGNLMLQPAPGSTTFGQGKDLLGTVETIYTANIAAQMRILEGASLDEAGQSKDVMDVWLYENLAQSIGVHIGENLSISVTLSGEKKPVRVAGIWRAKDRKADFWFSNPDTAYNKALLVRRKDYIRFVQPLLASGSAEVSWYVILDENKIVPMESSHYLEGYQHALTMIDQYLPGARMNMPPLDPLEKFVQRSAALTVLLLGYNLPAFAILLYFLILTSAIMARWQRRETGMLVSRGMSISGILGIIIIEQAILFIIGYPAGAALGMLIAWLMGHTASFLAFTPRATLPVSMEGINFPLTLLALAFALFSRLLPAAQSARSSMVSEERERARPVHKPFWYRFYLDILLLAPTYYAYDQMLKRGSLAGLVTSKPEDLYRDPLLVVVPALFILTLSLVTVRAYALLMRLVDLVSGVIPWLTLHLALRQLGRQSIEYVRPLVLVIIALAMGVYTLAMAASLDQWTIDRMYYRAGADFVFTPQPGPSGEAYDANWAPIPQDYRDLPGIRGATRVGDYDMRISPDTSDQLIGRFLAVDRAEFASVAWFRSDFASESLGAMMNQLAPVPEGILVSEQLLKQRRLQVGDILTMKVDIEGIASVTSEFLVVGAYQYFPTVYDDEVTIIGNLDYISTELGVIPAHSIWLKLDPGVDTKALQDSLVNVVHIQPTRITDTRELIREEENRLERVGIFGTLTVGFLATALMSILGLLVYSYASLQDRAYRLAVLNAVGLSRRQLIVQVVMEYAFLAVSGALAGALIGVFSARLFIPFFRYTGEKGIPLPPLLPVLAGEQLRTLSLLFALVITLVEVITITWVLRGRLSQILKRVWM